MNKVISIAAVLIGSACAIFCPIMTVMAVRFMELGRVVFYLTLAIMCIGIAVWGIMNLPSKKS